MIRKKRLKKLMGVDYDKKPALRLILERLEGVGLVDDMDGGRSVEWSSLETKRERKIAMAYFTQGTEAAEKKRMLEESLWDGNK